MAVVAGRAVLFHRVGGELVAEGLEAATGEPVWKATFPTNYSGQVSADNGPRCVPLIHESFVYLLGPAGELACVSLASGKRIWFRQVYQETQGVRRIFRRGEQPDRRRRQAAVERRRSQGSGVGGLFTHRWLDRVEGDRRSGQLFIAGGGDDRRRATRDLRDAVERRVDRSAERHRAISLSVRVRGPTVNAANPLVLGDHLFVSASYGVGAAWAKIGPDKATVEWDSGDVMSSQYTTCVEKDGLFYGIDGRQDLGDARLRCFDPRTGKLRWTKNEFGTGNLILAGDKLLVTKTDGELVLVEPVAKEYRELARTRLFDTTVQALPALADGRLFVRDTKQLKCLEVGKSDTPVGKKAGG